MVVATVGDRRRAAADREPGGVMIDQESRYRRALTPRALLGAGHREQHHEVGDIGMADEVLGAADDPVAPRPAGPGRHRADRKSTRLNSSHPSISYAVFCLKKKKQNLELIVVKKTNTNKRNQTHRSNRH